MFVNGPERLQRTFFTASRHTLLRWRFARQVPPFMAWQPPAWAALSRQAPKPEGGAPLLRHEGLTATARAKQHLCCHEPSCFSGRRMPRLHCLPHSISKPRPTETMANCAGWAWALPTIRSTATPSKLPAQIVPGEHWFGSALHWSTNWRRSDAARRGACVFAPSIGCCGCLCRGGGRPGATR